MNRKIYLQWFCVGLWALASWTAQAHGSNAGDIRIDGHHAVIRGVEQLVGASVNAPDIRAGAALVVAGLVASGETVINDIHHIDRGYDDLVGRLTALGARITRRS